MTTTKQQPMPDAPELARRMVTATTAISAAIEAAAIAPAPRFPTDDEQSLVWNALEDVNDNLLGPFARCVHELINAEVPPAVTYEDIGRLACATDDLRTTLRYMLAELDRLDVVRDDLGQLARVGQLEREPIYDAQGWLIRAPIDTWGEAIHVRHP
jgi:hypothetical protein